MAWVRLHDGAMQNMKVASLSDSAFRLWVRGLCYCQTALTDGLIPHVALRDMGAKRKDVDELSAIQVPGHGPLWDRIEGFGFKVHDYLHWNDSREAVLRKQRLAKHRKAFLTDPELRHALRGRDGDACRYCGQPVNWADRKGVSGATYDHVDPDGPATLENLVVACRGCNSSKRDRTPEQAGMRLRPVPEVDDLDRNLDSESRFIPGTKPNQTKPPFGIDQNPPTPPSAKGGRITRKERKRAEDLRRRSFGCTHEPRCPNYDSCITTIVLGLREQAVTA